MRKNAIRYATFFALGTAVFSGVNSFLTKIAVTAVANPIVFTTLKNAIVAIFIIGIILGLRKWREIKSLTKEQSIKLIAIGAIGGSVPFALFFTGLLKTSAINAALIHKTLFLWVLLFAIPILKERITKLQWVGIGAIFAANLFIGGFVGFKLNAGELMILGATILWAVENIIAKKALKELSSITVAAARMTIGSFLLFLLVFWQGNVGMLSGMGTMQWGWTILTSLLLLGYVFTWYTALKYAPATYVAMLIIPATLITNILSVIFITHSFTVSQLISSLLYVAGITLIILFTKETADQLSKKQLSPVAD